MKSETPKKVRSKKTRSFAGVVRERLAEIEKKMEQGFTHEGIRQELMAEGFEASLQSFSSTLARARQSKKASAQPHVGSTLPTDMALQSLPPSAHAPAPGPVPSVAPVDYFKRPSIFQKGKPS